MSDSYRHDNSVLSPARSLRAVTPADGSDLPDGACKALHIGGAGTLSVITIDDVAAVSLTVAQGILPIRALRVRSTGTTATSIVALY